MSDPYSKDAQIFTFGIHGTNNDTGNIREVARRISVAVGETTDGANLFDNGFSWKAQHTVGRNHPVAGTAHLTNGTSDREIASQRFAAHVLQQVDKAIERGTLDRDKPLTINLVGFSHGGNVAILASDEISEGLKRRGIESAIHLTTLSTPAYTWGNESPTRARELVQADGVKFAHTHFSTPGDRVITLASGNANYDNGFTRDINFNRGVSNFDGVANHGAVQDRGEYMDVAASVMRQRFNGLAPAQRRADAGDTIQLAGISPAAQGNANVNWDAFNKSPAIQQIATALDKEIPTIGKDNLNPSMLAVLAEKTIAKNFNVDNVSLSTDQQTVFLSDRAKGDPTANVVAVKAELGNQQIGKALGDMMVAMQSSQNNSTIATEVPEPARKTSQLV